jgi:t-SNARE complex subunit (syntaxin)
MSVDRLKDLHDITIITNKYIDVDDTDVKSTTADHLTLSKQKLSEFTSIKKEIQAIKETIDKINEISDNYIRSVTKNEKIRLMNEFDQITSINVRRINDIKIKLTTFGYNKQIFSYIKYSLQSTTNEYVLASTKFRKLARDVEIRQLEIVDSSVTVDDEDLIMQITTSPNSTDLTQSTVDSKLDGSLANIEERHSKIVQLERNAAEIHQLFTDMSIFIDQQGEVLNNIDDHVAASKDYVESGESDLVIAEDLQKTYRKIIFGFCCCIVLVFVILSIVLSVLLKSSM